MTTHRLITRLSAIAVASMVALAACRPSHPESESDSHEADDGALKAEQWFQQQRAFPGRTIPAGARQAALAELRRKWPALARGVSASIVRGGIASAASSTVPWVAAGPAPILANGTFTGTNVSGRVNTIAIDPTTSQTIYIGAASGGVWKTINGGTTWNPMTDSQCGLAMGSIAIDSVNPQIVYAGTGELNNSADSYQGCGVLRSTDGGTTWTQMGVTSFAVTAGAYAHISRILIDKATAGSVTTTVVNVAASSGLWHSTTSGMTWTKVASISTSRGFSDMVADPNTPATMYAAQYGVGIYKSTNTGLTWTLQAGVGAIPAASLGRISLGISTTAPQTLYAALANESNGTSNGALLGLYKSLDGGVTWAAVTATGASCALQCWYDMALAVDPTNANIVYFSGFSLYKSVNGGTTFTDIGTSIHVDQHAVVFDPTSNTTIYAGSDGGVFKSTTGGTSWTTLNTSLNITQFYPGIAISPTSATTFIGGSQDNGTTEGGAALSWSSQLGGDGAMAAYDWKSGATFAGFTHGSSTDSPQRRDAGSSSWAVKNAGINTNDNANWVPPMTMDPRNPSVLYFGTNRVYRTSNSGDAWTAISPDLTSGGNLAAIAVAPSDSQTVYTGSSDGMVEVTTDLGLTWTPITTGLPVRSVTKIIVDPLDPRTAWLTVSGFSTGHVFKTVNGGRQWTDLSNNLPNDPASAIVLQAGSRELDVGTDIGVFALADGTTSWVPLMTGLPNVVITDLAYDGPRGRLVAGTHGRGIWTLPVATAVLRGNITNTGTLNPMDAQAILSAVAGKPLPAGYVRYPNGDANCDGTVTAEDALLVLMNLVGANTSGFCVGKNK